MAALNAGRPPKPAELKRLEGTARKCRENARAPAGAPLEALPMPPGLTEREQAAWAELAAVVAPMRVVTPSDVPAFRQMVTTRAMCAEARDDIRNEGQTYTVVTESGAVKRKNPSVEVLATFTKLHDVQLAQFGLTPAARQRVSAIKPDAKGDPLDEFAVGGHDA
jgi:P27 family predicted phage terminase small subunit